MGDRRSVGRGRRRQELAATVLAVTTLVVARPALILAATPVPTRPGGDTRSSGEGPGLVGEPLLAIGLVVAIAVVTILVTLAYVRLTAGRAAARRPRT